MSRLGLVSAGEANISVSSWSQEANVSVSSRSRPVTPRAHPWDSQRVHFHHYGIYWQSEKKR